MGVVLYRIDDRLIHGQVMTAWSKVYKSTNIICVDDETARNEMLCSIMKMAVPSDYAVHILTTEDAIKEIKAEPESKRTIVLAKTPGTMLDLAKSGVGMKELNVGNIGQGPNRKPIMRSTQVSPSELDQLKELQKMGVKVYLQVFPDEKAVNLSDLNF